MSRAFVKERTGELVPLPDLRINPHPKYMTPRGFETPQAPRLARQADLHALRARAERLDKHPKAAAERDFCYRAAPLRTACVIDPAAQGTLTAAFGLGVTLTIDHVPTARHEIPGEDEADVLQFPFARALFGAEVGNKVLWRKPSGTASLTVPGTDRP